MTENVKGLMLDDLVRCLVDENILPYYDNLIIYIANNIYNRKVLFNAMESIGLEFSEDLISFCDDIIKIDFTDISENHLKDNNSAIEVSIVNTNGVKTLDTDQQEGLMATTTLSNYSKVPVSCFIVNSKFELLSQKDEDDSLYFGKSPEKALTLFRKLAYNLIKKKEYKDCFIIEVQCGEINDTTKNLIYSFLIQSSFAV